MELVTCRDENSFSSKDPLSLDYSFGFDCKWRYNLNVLNGDTLLYATGRFLHFYDLSSGHLRYCQTTNSGGIGHVATFPGKSEFAVGEKGDNPAIIIYEWPSLEKIQILHGGAKKGFNYLTYNGNGDLLASQSSKPDNLLTIWRWAEGEIFLNAKAYDHEVYQISFSSFYPDQLVSCGVNHLKIWKMSETFTGLKLLGQLGRFGKTDSCNLIGALLLPDGSCATGSVWGNILIWAEGAISLEIFRVGRLPCHTAPITQLLFHNNSLMTAGLDGAVRVWNYENIEMADPPEDDLFMEMEPLFEFLIADDSISAEIMCLVKSLPDSNDTVWYAQGSNGAVWRLDISINVGATPPKRVFSSHAGAVVALQTCPFGCFFATLGDDCKIMVYDYFSKQLEAFLEFSSAGTCLLWVPISVAASGRVLVAGFSDGVLRVLAFSNQNLTVVQAVKPHTSSIVDLAINADLLVTASDDGTIFIFRLELNGFFELVPIGFCKLDASASCLCGDTGLTFLVGCSNGDILKFCFQNCKSGDKTYRLDVKPEILVHFDETQNPIIFIWKSPFDSIWFAQNTKDSCSSIYEFHLLRKEIVKTVHNFTSTGISCFYYWSMERCLFFGLSDGTITANRFDENGQILPDRWSCGIHDCDRGAIRQLAVSWDNLKLFTCGDDGAIFSFNINGFIRGDPEVPKTAEIEKFPMSLDITKSTAFSLEESKIKENRDEQIRLADESKKSVLKSVERLRKEYQEILKINESLPFQVQITNENLVPDQRVVDDLRNNLDDEEKLVYRKIARDAERSKKQLYKLNNYFLDGLETLVTRVSAIKENIYVETVRVKKIDEEFYKNLEAVQKIVDEMEKQGRLEEEIKLSLRAQDVPKPPDVSPAMRPESPDPVDALVKQVAALGDVSRNRKLVALCRQHRARREAAAARSQVWENHMRRKPDPDRVDPKDLIAIEIANETFGDYKLKTSPDYRVPKHRNVNAINKYKALLEARLRIYNIKNVFNEKVFNLRKRKQEMIQNHSAGRAVLESIAKEIPKEMVKKSPDHIKVNYDTEFPENRYIITDSDLESELPAKFRKSKPPEKTPDPVFDLEFEILQTRNKKPCIVKSANIAEMQLAVSDDMETPWETEMKEMRVLRKCEEQNKIISEMEKDIEKFDEDVVKLSEEKVYLEVDTKYLELHLLMLHREILVLKAFEKEEMEKSKISFKLLTEQRDIQQNLNQLTALMEEKVREIQGHEFEVKILVSNFLESITESKYYEYLKRIFKKKYKPPKNNANENEDSSSDSSSDSDENEDEKSLDSKELNMKFNENVCPENCDVRDYERTFELRSKRHDWELKIAEKRKSVDQLKKKFDMLTKQKRKIELDYGKAQNDFDNLQRNKQTELNEIETLVVLRLSQFQNFKIEDEMETMDDSLILRGEMMTQLYNRVGELSRETTQQKEKHELNKQHLTRMMLDIRHMTLHTVDLENQIQQSMFKKFGTKVDLDELEEALVKKLIAEMNFIPFEMQQKLERKLKNLQEKLEDRIDAYTSRMSENTKRFNILSILKDESSKLEDALTRQEMKKTMQGEMDVPTDLGKLTELVQKQTNDVARLKEEVLRLKSKTRPHSSGAFKIREMSQMALICGPDGEYQEISPTVRIRISSMLADAQEFTRNVEDAKCKKGLKNLVGEFMEEIPERALSAIWEQLSHGRDLGNLDEMLDNEDILLQAADIMIQMIGTIVPSVCGVGQNR